MVSEVRLTVDEVLVSEHQTGDRVEVERRLVHDVVDERAGLEELQALVPLLLQQGHVSLKVDVALRVHAPDTERWLLVLHLVFFIVAEVEVNRGLLTVGLGSGCLGVGADMKP